MKDDFDPFRGENCKNMPMEMNCAMLIR